MEDDFAALYQKLISRIEPDPDRLRRGLQALRRAITGHDPPGFSSNQLQSQIKCDIPGAETDARFQESEEREKDHEGNEVH